MALARALVTGAPDAGDAAFWEALGIPADMRAGIVQSSAITEIWPENEAAFDLFARLQTQWRTGMNGPTGLDYAVLPAMMSLHDIAQADRAQLFDNLQVMEYEALRVFNDKHG